MTNAYDLIRYPSLPFWRTHPAGLGALAALYGKPFTPLDRARVLEIGCGEGVNLLNIALWAPIAECVGVDLAQAPIAIAEASAEAMGLANVRFHVQDILDMDDRLGAFDYVIAHGVYAWVPDVVREKLMRVVGRLLSPNGLAFISYNAYPGSHLRLVLRDLLLDATRGLVEPDEKLRVSWAVLEQQIATWSEAEPSQAAMIAAAREMLDRSPEELFHDELSEFFAPQYLTDVVAAARAAGLDYLCDAHPPLNEEAFFPSERHAPARERARGDWVRFEQLTDFDTMRRFRNSVFCHGGGADRRRAPERLRGLQAGGRLEPIEAPSDTPDAFAFRVGQAGTMTTNNPDLAKLIGEIGAASPSLVALDRAAEDPELAASVLRLFCRKCIALSVAPAPVAATPGVRPRASPLARLQAQRGDKLLTTLHQSCVNIEDEVVRDVIALLDGSRTRDDLAGELGRRLGLPAEDVSERLSQMLSTMAKAALLTT